MLVDLYLEDIIFGWIIFLTFETIEVLYTV